MPDSKAGQWLVPILVLAADVDVPNTMPHGHPLGIDLGPQFVATSEREIIHRPKFYVDAQSQRRHCCNGT